MLLRNIFFFSNHPIAIVVIIIIQSLVICSSIFILSHYRWFSLIIFLIFIGGLIVLFIYIARLASNEIFSINLKFILSISLISLIILVLLKIILPSSSFYHSSLAFKLSIFPIYSESFYSPTLIIMIYLLLTLIITVNIIKLYEAPIRSIL